MKNILDEMVRLRTERNWSEYTLAKKKKTRTFPIHHRRLVPQPSNTCVTDPG